MQMLGWTKDVAAQFYKPLEQRGNMLALPSRFERDRRRADKMQNAKFHQESRAGGS